MTEQTQGKGRPTPKRRDAEKRRGGPVAPPPTNRREAAKQARAKQAANRKGGRSSAARTERVLLARDAGPVRALVRDLVDARRNLGGLLMPAAALSIGSFFTKDEQVLAAISGIFVATLAGVAMDTVILGSIVRRRLRAEFPQEGKLGGHVFYGVLRSTVIRRMRMPKPMVDRGTRV